MSPMETKPLLTFCIQMRPQGDGPWPPLLRIKAHTICRQKIGNHDGMQFKIDSEVIGEVTGVVDAWWTEYEPVA